MLIFVHKTCKLEKRTSKINNVQPLKVQGASQETDVFEINITPLIFSVEFIYVGRSSSKVPYFFSRGMEADRNVKVVGGDVAVL